MGRRRTKMQRKWLLDMIHSNGWEIKDFAAKLGTSEHTVYNWLAGGLPARKFRARLTALLGRQVVIRIWRDEEAKIQQAQAREMTQEEAKEEVA